MAYEKVFAYDGLPVLNVDRNGANESNVEHGAGFRYEYMDGKGC